MLQTRVMEMILPQWKLLVRSLILLFVFRTSALVTPPTYSQAIESNFPFSFSLRTCGKRKQGNQFLIIL